MLAPKLSQNFEWTRLLFAVPICKMNVLYSRRLSLGSRALGLPSTSSTGLSARADNEDD
jgi:hypothetical protein